jgi:Tol biopolymer transport system component
LVTLGLLAGHFLWRPLPAQPVFHDISFRRGAIFSGRFSGDGQVLYSARWEDQPIQIFSVQNAYPESRPASGPSTLLLSLSRSGQMAILRDARYLHHLQWSGTLAVMRLGGAPRDWIDNVEGADWDPSSDDTRRIAVIRPQAGPDGRMILEFPIGHTIYSTTGWISHVRVSPDGDKVAFLDHPVINDSLGDVAVVDRAGVKKTLSSGWSAESGLAWSPDGQEVWFSAARAGTGLAIYAVSLGGRRRDLMAGPGRLVLQDVSRDGRLLVTRDSVRAMMTASIAGEREARELSWLDESNSPSFTRDGKGILFTEGGKAVGPHYAVCMRRVDGSGGVVRLGEGTALGLSPDGKWALTSVPGPPGELDLLSVAGESLRTLKRGSIQTYSRSGGWLPDGQRVLFTAYEPGKPERVYIQSVDGGESGSMPKPILPAGYSAVFQAISPEGRSVACRSGGTYRICPLDPPDGDFQGGEPPAIPGLLEGEQPLRWTPDGRFLYVCDTAKLPLRIFKLSASTGERQPWKEITPPDIAGLASPMTAVISPDGQSLVYGYSRVLSELFIVDR